MSCSVNHPYLPVAAENKLVLNQSKRTQKKGMDNDDDYYDEVNPAGELVATYHIWHHMNVYPPQSTNEGWAKFDVAGLRIDSGKCD
jgi:hypothetical protein